MYYKKLFNISKKICVHKLEVDGTPFFSVFVGWDYGSNPISLRLGAKQVQPVSVIENPPFYTGSGNV